MSLTKYTVFMKVAELESLTKAAQVLGYSQPAISHNIISLEERFGFPLFNRNHDRCTLTENGRKMLEICSQVVRDEQIVDDTVHSINGLLTGSLRIGSICSMLQHFVPSVVFNFTTAYSNIDLSIDEFTYREVIERLKDGSIDVGFTTGRIPKGLKIRFIPLFKDPIRLIVPKGHPFDHYEKVPASVLNGCDFILPSSKYDDIFDTLTDSVSVAPNVKFRVNSEIASLSMVANHLGVTIMSGFEAFAYTSMGNHQDVVVKNFQEDLYRSLGIAISSQYRPTPPMKAFIRAACTNCGKESPY